MKYLSRREAGLPVYPDSYYPGPYKKYGVCLHNMAVGSPSPITLGEAFRITRSNYEYHLSRWKAIDILEGYDLYNVEGEPVVVEARPWWANCDAFSGMKKLGYQYVGVEVVGDYDGNAPSDTILRGIAQFLADCYLSGKIVELEMKGHRDFNHLSSVGPTSCPGLYLYPLIPDLIKEAERIVRRKEDEEDMKIAVQEMKTSDGKPMLDSDGWLIYNVPSVNRKWWLDISNEHGRPIQVRIWVNPQDKDANAGGEWKGPVPPTTAAKPGVHSQLDVLCPTLNAEWSELSIHAEKPLSIMVGN